MKLSYRGATYQASASTVESTESNAIGLYRGRAFKLVTPVERAIAHQHTLTYRGLEY